MRAWTWNWEEGLPGSRDNLFSRECELSGLWAGTPTCYVSVVVVSNFPCETLG